MRRLIVAEVPKVSEELADLRAEVAKLRDGLGEIMEQANTKHRELSALQDDGAVHIAASALMQVWDKAHDTLRDAKRPREEAGR